jgi:hypothetical protein
VGTVGITKRIRETSPCFKARIAGILYLLMFIAAPSFAYSVLQLTPRLVADGEIDGLELAETKEAR